MTTPKVNLAEVETKPHGKGEHYQARLAAIGRLTGLEKLGCRLVVLESGKKAWPFHAHTVNEEMYVVLEGRGALRLGDEILAVRAGDVIAAKVGQPHQMINDSPAALRYLCISTMLDPEVAFYPDSGKFGVLAGSPPGGDPSLRVLDFFGYAASAVDYWDGEA